MSTQLGIVNSETCKAVYDMGATARYLPVSESPEEIRHIRKTPRRNWSWRPLFTGQCACRFPAVAR